MKVWITAVQANLVRSGDDLRSIYYLCGYEEGKRIEFLSPSKAKGLDLEEIEIPKQHEADFHAGLVDASGDLALMTDEQYAKTMAGQMAELTRAVNELSVAIAKSFNEAGQSIINLSRQMKTITPLKSGHQKLHPPPTPTFTAADVQESKNIE